MLCACVCSTSSDLSVVYVYVFSFNCKAEPWKVKMSEQPCYTLINNPSETEIPNEQQLRNDLGKRERERPGGKET